MINFDGYGFLAKFATKTDTVNFYAGITFIHNECHYFYLYATFPETALQVRSMNLVVILHTRLMSWYQKGRTNLDFTEARDSEWQWHQLGHMQSAPRSRQTTMPAPHHLVFTGRMPFLPPNQQRQRTKGSILWPS